MYSSEQAQEITKKGNWERTEPTTPTVPALRARIETQVVNALRRLKRHAQNKTNAITTLVVSSAGSGDNFHRLLR